MDFRSLAFGLVAAAMSIACDRASKPVQARAAIAPLDFMVKLTGGAGAQDALPMVVVLHGRGDQPSNFTKRLDGYTAPARFVYLEAPIDEGKGRGWFTFDRGPGGWKRTSDKVLRLGERTLRTVETLLERYPTTGKPVLTGFSQGAMVVYAAVLAYPDRFVAALPVSGALFESILPSDMTSRGKQLPPIVVFHGDEDPVIPASAGERAATMLRSYGAHVELKTFPEIPHWIMGSMKDALLDEIRRFAKPPDTQMKESR